MSEEKKTSNGYTPVLRQYFEVDGQRWMVTEAGDSFIGFTPVHRQLHLTVDKRAEGWVLSFYTMVALKLHFSQVTATHLEEFFNKHGAPPNTGEKI